MNSKKGFPFVIVLIGIVVAFAGNANAESPTDNKEPLTVGRWKTLRGGSAENKQLHGAATSMYINGFLSGLGYGASPPDEGIDFRIPIWQCLSDNKFSPADIEALLWKDVDGGFHMDDSPMRSAVLLTILKACRIVKIKP